MAYFGVGSVWSPSIGIGGLITRVVFYNNVRPVIYIVPGMLMHGNVSQRIGFFWYLNIHSLVSYD